VLVADNAAGILDLTSYVAYYPLKLDSRNFAVDRDDHKINLNTAYSAEGFPALSRLPVSIDLRITKTNFIFTAPMFNGKRIAAAREKPRSTRLIKEAILFRERLAETKKCSVHKFKF
jgi:hypothetical protein